MFKDKQHCEENISLKSYQHLFSIVINFVYYFYLKEREEDMVNSFQNYLYDIKKNNDMCLWFTSDSLNSAMFRISDLVIYLELSFVHSEKMKNKFQFESVFPELFLENIALPPTTPVYITGIFVKNQVTVVVHLWLPACHCQIPA